MATAVEARITSNVVKVEIWARGLSKNERQWTVSSTYWRRRGGATAREFVQYYD
jgi:hypothetical protein